MLATVALTSSTKYSGGGCQRREVSSITWSERRMPSGSTPLRTLLPHSTVSVPLGDLAHGDGGHAHDAALLLHRPAVREHTARIALQRDEVEETERLIRPDRL